MKETGSSCLITRPSISVADPGLIGKLEMRFLGIPDKEKNEEWGTTICGQLMDRRVVGIPVLGQDFELI